MNYLASPPLVIAYALAGTMDFDFETEPLGQDNDGNGVFLQRHLAVFAGDLRRHRVVDRQESVHRQLCRCVQATSAGRTLPTPKGKTFDWDPKSTYVRKSPYFDGMPADPSRSPTSAARACSPCSVIRSPPTTSLPPATSSRARLRRKYLEENGVDRKDYNSYG